MTTRPRVVTTAVLAISLVYVAAWLVLPRSGLFINDNGCKLIQTEGVIRNGGIDVSVPWPGRELDPGLRFPPFWDPFGKVIDGRLFISFPLPFALATSLPFRLFGIAGNTLLPLLGGLLLLPAVAALARLLGAGAAGTWLAVLGVGLGTPVWFYAYTLWEHLPATCLVTWGLVLLLRAQGAARAPIWSAVLCGLAVWLRDDLVLFALAMAVIPIVMRERRATRGWGATAWFLAVLAVTLLPLGVAQWILLGSPFGIHATTHGPFDAGIAPYIADRWTVFRDLVVDSHRIPWISLVAAVPYVLLLALFPRLQARQFARAAEILLVWAIGWGVVALAGHLASRSPVWHLQSANGLFAVSPWLILSCLRAREPAPVRSDAPHAYGGPCAIDGKIPTALWLVVLIYIGLYSLAAPVLHVSGVHWGSRLLLPLFPVLGALAGAAAGRLLELREGAPWLRAALLVGGAVALSVAFQLHGLRLLAGEVRFEAQLADAVLARPETDVIATSWVVPQELARMFYAKRVYLVRSPVDMQALTTILRTHGETRVLRIDAAPGTLAQAPAVEASSQTQYLGDEFGFMTYRLSTVELR